ncbi:MAG: aminotransferase class I/II-fold pyridoxal phosphate-dependent enzyme [Candidatus Kapabacteria bacterium]|nr:aminotransferase class I/II-fold pyridoxal phosphate-dependent enzyme [Candidatus Kapabacteria bacterium]
MIDLRSDTVTKPTEEMRKVIANAEVGDDVYGEDPSVNELQNYVAELFGKEASLFVSSGVMGNQLALKALTNPGDEVIVESQSHIFYYETAAPSVISRVQLRPIESKDGMPDVNLIKNSIRSSEYYFPKTSLICLENTHNRHSGTIISIDYIREVKKLAIENNIRLHCDGARIWNACIETGISPKVYAEPFDTLSVCLSKGLGAPVGSLLIGSKEVISTAKKWRKILGGGMRQVGILAAAGLYAIKSHFPLLKEDHINAKKFSEILSNSPFIDINLSKVQTNIAYFHISDDINAQTFIEKLKEKEILISQTENNSFRAVFHLQINFEQAIYSAKTILETLNELKK